MPISVIPVIAVVVAVVALAMHTAWRRRQLAERLRDRWGKVPPTVATPDSRDGEAWRELRQSGDEDLAVDDRTWTDLDLDVVLAAIDRTHTSLGAQILYRRLRSGAAWSESPTQESLTARFGAEPELRERVGVRLASAGRSLGRGLWIITRPELIVVKWWYWSFPLLAIGMFVSIVMVPFVPRALLVAIGIVVVNMIVRMATAWQIPGLLAPMRQMGPLIRVAEELGRIDGVAPPDIASDIPRLRPLRRIAQWVSRDPIASGELLAALWEYLNIMFVLDANALPFSARRLRALSPVLTRVALWIGDVDVALSVASLRAEPRAWSVPAWTPLVRTELTGVWHPLIAEPVTNDAELRAGKGIIVTGANMSGKSTYLRTVGIAAELARAFNTVPAASWRGRSFRVRSLIGRSDDLAAGKSYYQVEADGVVSLLRDATRERATLFLLDELLRGTNTIERLAAGEAVLRALLAPHPNGSPHVVIVATHDGELVTMLGDLYLPYHFRETVAADGLVFDYRRREGPASTRTAIALLEATGAPGDVVAAARARAEELDGVGRARSG